MSLVKRIISSWVANQTKLPKPDPQQIGGASEYAKRPHESGLGSNAVAAE
jgi:hypothetical protein